MPDCLTAQSANSRATLPMPDAKAQVVSERLMRQILRAIDQSGGAIPFDQFMEMALYAPGLGYYVAGSRKFGDQGDFITAPEVSSLFAQCLARQIAQLLPAMPDGEILEFGAGSGVLAADMLTELAALEQLPSRYLILEVSPELQGRQKELLRERVPDLIERVIWLDAMPQNFSGCVVANELLDAMPVSRFRVVDGQVEECFVEFDGENLKACFKTPITPGLTEAVDQLQGNIGRFESGYISEINLRQAAWLKSLSQAIRRGAVLLIDYGYSCAEYYHPQRNEGTLMCHYRHRAHSDPFRWVGIQDITCQVDFTSAAKVALESGFRLGGYTTQAHFLIANGLDTLLADSDPEDVVRHMALMQGVKRLTLPSEMGERFKVLGLLKDLQLSMQGFTMRDMCERL
ncbi:MAG: class I SAM-dependent methyltransferase [Candidatus Thiodiazotropha sp. 6PLUC2]